MLTVMRAEELWQSTGAFYVRIQAMARQHHIPLRDEFDEHDGGDTRYIVMLEDGFPVATCRMYRLDEQRVMIGRLVVLQDYRGRGLGHRVLEEAETWALEMGYRVAVLESRDNAVGFYEKAGYVADYQQLIHGVTFECVHMEKPLTI